jgi:hypothetical protein
MKNLQDGHKHEASVKMENKNTCEITKHLKWKINHLSQWMDFITELHDSFLVWKPNTTVQKMSEMRN